jgi:hypothetical protein
VNIKCHVARIRDFLKRNEIFITVLQVFIIGFVGLYLAYGSYRLQKLQSASSEYEHLPHIRVDEGLGYDEETKQYAHDKIEVFNDGFDLSSPEIREACFLEISYSTRDNPQGKVLLPLNGYFAAASYTNARRGKLFSLFGINNNSKMANLEREFRRLVQGSGSVPNLELKKYLRSKYTDFVGKAHEDYFIVGSIYGGQPVNPETGSTLFAEHKQAFSDSMLEFDQLSAEQIVQTFESKTHLIIHK